MSKNLGLNYLTDVMPIRGVRTSEETVRLYPNKMVKWHLDDLQRTYVIQEGFKVAMPRYYRNRIYTERQRESIALRAEKAAMAKELKARVAFYRRNKTGQTYEHAQYESKKAQLHEFFLINNLKRSKT